MCYVGCENLLIILWDFWNLVDIVVVLDCGVDDVIVSLIKGGEVLLWINFIVCCFYGYVVESISVGEVIVFFDGCDLIVLGICIKLFKCEYLIF